MDERYPIGETETVAVAVLRHERREAGYPMWSASIGLRGGEATVTVPGHYPGVPRTEVEPLAQLLDDAQRLIEELRQGLGLVPDSLPDGV